MNMMQVNWGLLAERLLPIVFRKPFWIAWLRVLLKPLDTLNTWFHSQITASLYLLNFNSQTLLLEWHLRNYFESPAIQIINQLNYVDDAIVYDAILNIDAPMVYDRNHLLPLPQTDEMIVYAVSPSFGVNLIVEVPLSLQSRDKELRQMIERYTHATYLYQITYA